MKFTRALLRLDFVEELMKELKDAEVDDLTQEQERLIIEAWSAVKAAKEEAQRIIGPWPCVRQ